MRKPPYTGHRFPQVSVKESPLHTRTFFQTQETIERCPRQIPPPGTVIYISPASSCTLYADTTGPTLLHVRSCTQQFMSSLEGLEMYPKYLQEWGVLQFKRTDPYSLEVSRPPSDLKVVTAANEKVDAHMSAKQKAEPDFTCCFDVNAQRKLTVRPSSVRSQTYASRHMITSFYGTKPPSTQ